jgi:hypothetical protein
MTQVIWSGKPISKEALFQDAEPQYIETSKKVFELEKKIALASPDPDKAREITVSVQNMS